VTSAEIGLSTPPPSGSGPAEAEDGDGSRRISPIADASLDRSYAVIAGADVDIDLAIGDVEATRAAGTMLRVVVQLRPGASPGDISIREHETGVSSVKLGIEPKGSGKGGFSILGGNVRIGSFGGGREARAIESVRLEIPEGVRLSLSTGAGDVQLTDLSADVLVESGAGDIKCTRLKGGLEIESGAGDVTVSSIDGSVAVETGAGDVTIDGSAAKINVETGAGSIKVDVATPVAAEIDLATGVGAIDIRVPSIASHVHAESGMGSIACSVAAGGFALDASSGMGGVTLRTNGHEERSGGMGGELRRRVNEGGPTLRLESGAGSIEINAAAGTSSVTAD
jgi:hypothetical protein